MQAHRMHIVVPEDHRMTIEFPKTIQSGPVELIVLAPSPAKTEAGALAQGSGRIKTLADELTQDPRPFRELSPEERSARLERVMGVGRGLMSTSEELAQQKSEEIEIEARKFGR